jgi:hypothetical protein
MSLLLLMAGLGTGIDIYKRFVRQSPEYLWAHKPTVKKGLFGFAYRRGWKTIGGLYRTGSLNAPYISNEKSDVTKYYLGKSQSALGDAQIILNVEGAQTFRNKIPIPDGFVQFLTVRVHGKPAIQAYAKTAPWPGIKVLDAETSDPAFHQIDLAAAP